MCKCVTMSEKMWKNARENECCEGFTDEELEKAKKDRIPIKRGWVLDFGVVDMYVDTRVCDLKNISDAYGLKADYLGGKLKQGQ